MSVRTTADEKLDEARDAVKIALKALTEIVIEDCWGHDEFSTSRFASIEASYQELLVIWMRLR